MVDIVDNSSTTTTIAVGGTIQNTLEVAGDHDWIRINLTQNQEITVFLEAITSTLDPYLRIRNSSGQVIWESDDINIGVNLDSLLSFQATYTGVYYIDVSAFDSPTNTGEVGDYRLTVTPYQDPPVWTYDQIATQLVSGYWGDGQHKFAASSGGQISVNITGLTAAGQALALAALQTWTDIIGITFVQTSSPSAQIRFTDDDPGGGAFTDASYANGIISTAQVNVDSDWLDDYGDQIGDYSFQAYIHEIGHALGLGHAGNYNTTAEYPYQALFANDGWPATIMSYFSQTESSYYVDRNFSHAYVVTPMVADIIAIQQLYGSSTTTRAGDTIYGYNSNAGVIYDATQTNGVALTIFDVGGTDTLDYSESFSVVTLNLNEESYSNVFGLVGSLYIARGTVIENAIGGTRADFLYGSTIANTLTGGGGRDTLTGGAGNDTFRDTAGGLNQDIITDFGVGDRIVISDATLAGFTFSQVGGTLNFTGGSLTLSVPTGGSIVASAAAGGGVQLTVNPNDVRHDFNGDGRSDFLLRSDAGWLTQWVGTGNGSFINNGSNVSLFFPNNWQVVGTGDFNGDGKDDFLLRNSDGWLTEWIGSANGSFTNNGANVSLFFNNDWQVVGTGDFNGDGKDDFLLRNSAGWLTEWLGSANGSFTNNGSNVSLFFSNDWDVVGTGDFNGDGKDDFLLRNSAGWLTEWLGSANGSFTNNGSNVSLFFNNDWQVVGTGDFNGDGKDDFLLRNSAGWLTEWLGSANGSFTNNGANVSLFFTNDWDIDSIGDFNGDGMDDFLLRNDAGWLTEWLGSPNGGFTNNGANVSTFFTTDWHVQAPDILI